MRSRFLVVAGVCALSTLLVMGCAPAKHRTAVLKANGKKTTGGTTTGKAASFAQYAHDDQPDQSGLYDYLANNEPQSLQAVTTGQNRFYEDTVILKLNSDHTYNLFYEEYMTQRDAHGNDCSQIQDGEVQAVRPHLLNVEKDGQWHETQGQLFLDTMATGAITAADDSGQPTITLNFNTDLDTAHPGLLKDKPDSVEPVQYTLSATDLHSDLSTDVMTADNAGAALDKACGKASAYVPAATTTPATAAATAKSAAAKRSTSNRR